MSRDDGLRPGDTEEETAYPTHVQHLREVAIRCEQCIVNLSLVNLSLRVTDGTVAAAYRTLADARDSLRWAAKRLDLEAPGVRPSETQPTPSPCSECEGSGVIEDDATGAMGYVVQKTCPSCNGKTVAAQGVEVDGVVYEADSGIAVMFSRLMKAEAEVARLRMGHPRPAEVLPDPPDAPKRLPGKAATLNDYELLDALICNVTCAEHNNVVRTEVLPELQRRLGLKNEPRSVFGVHYCPVCKAAMRPSDTVTLSTEPPTGQESAQATEERDAKRVFAEHLLRVVETGRRVARLQPASHAKTQEEADAWGAFYLALNEAPVGWTVSKEPTEQPPSTDGEPSTPVHVTIDGKRGA